MKINTAHRYEYFSFQQCIMDCQGKPMDCVYEYVDELNLLMDEIKRLTTGKENNAATSV